MENDTDLHQEIREERQMEKLAAKYTKPLTPGQIFDAFPNECYEFVPGALQRQSKAMAFHISFLKILRSDKSDPEFSAFQEQVEKKIYMKKKDKNKYEELQMLSRLMCKTTRGVTEQDIQRAKEVDIWRLHYFRNKKGKSACCPFHIDDTPSFAVRANKWICFGCGLKGDSIDFIQHLNNLPFYKAVEFLIKNY